MSGIIAILNSHERLRSILASMENDLPLPSRHYTDVATLIGEINSKIVSPGDLALFIVTGTSRENDPEIYRKTMSLLGQFKKHSRLARVPVLFLGFRGCRELQNDCEEFVADYIDLPAKKSELLARIRDLTPRPQNTGGVECREGQDVQERPLPEGEGGVGKKFLVEEPLSFRERGAPEAGVRSGSEPHGGEKPITIGHVGSRSGSEHDENEQTDADYRKNSEKQGSEPQRKTGITEALTPGSPRAESERRLATIMFADISGFTAMSEKMDPEEVTGVMNACFEMLGRHVARYGGHIDKFIGDCIMVCFGIPKALENAPLNAVNTAIAMKAGLYRFNREHGLAIPLDIHIGINTGPVVAGTVGSEERKDYTVMGDAVNLASRIEGASEKGQILVGPDTNRATRDDFEFRALTPVSLKGKAEPVPVYEVTSIKEAAPRRREGLRPDHVEGAVGSGPDRMIYSELVGRDRELNELRHLVTGLVKGKGGIVNVIGEAGIGKSRLMAELKSDPAMKQVILLEGQAISMGRNLSFHPIIDLLKNWAGIREDDGEADSFGKLDKAVRAIHPAEADEIVPFVATLMGMKLSGKYAERMKGIEGEALEKLIFKNVRELLIKGSELSPMIIRIEDLHWADTSSIELLSALFRLAKTHRILFLNFFRPNYEETGDRVVKTVKEDFADSYTGIIIQPLDENESATLISNLLNIKGLPQSLKDQITERAGGNPFFIEEVVRSLIDDGAVIRKGDSFAVTEKINSVTVPLTINEVLMSRIDRLDEETKNLIKTASVIGRYFFYKIISQVAENVSDIDRRLGYLEDIQLIRERKRMDELEYLFKHALAQEAAYESLLIQKRKELHLQVAQSIEGVFHERLHEFYGMLAYHYSKGDDLEKTEEYMIKAGEEAMKSSASSEALEYFKEAMQLYVDKIGDRADQLKMALFHKNIALSYYRKGLFAESIPYLNKVLKFYNEPFPSNPFSYYAKFITGLIHLIIAIWLPRLKWKSIPSDNDRLIVFLYHCRAEASSHEDIRQFFYSTFFAMKRFTSLKMSFLNEDYPIVQLSFFFSWPSISYTISKKIIRFSESHHPTESARTDLMLQHSVLMNEFLNGYWKAPGIDFAVIHNGLSVGEIYISTSNLIMYGFFYIETGDFPFAMECRSRLYATATAYDHAQAMVFSHDLETRILFKKRALDKVLDAISAGVLLAEKTDNRVINFEIQSIKARALLFQGDLTGAEECLAKLENVSHELYLIPYYLSDYRIARFIFDMHRLEDVIQTGDKTLIKEYRANAKRSGVEALKISRKFKRDRTEAMKLTGTYWWLLGKPGKALRWWKKSIDVGERLGARLELSRTYFEVGKRTIGTTTPPHPPSGPPSPTGEGSAAKDPRRAHPSPYGRGSQQDVAVPSADRMSGKRSAAGGEVNKIIGLTPEECLAKAEMMFREMDLQWDLAELEKLRKAESI